MALIFSFKAHSADEKSSWEANRNHEWEAECIADHQRHPNAEFYLIESMLKSACADRLYGDTPSRQHLGTCKLARLTLAVTEQDVIDTIDYCRSTNGWH